MRKDHKSVYKLGVTGGIGSGKTSVCRVFNVLGIPVFSADPEAREIMDQDKSIRESINSLTGRDLYRNGVLDRSVLASLIFNNSSLLEKVNMLVHPVVFRHFDEWLLRQNTPYVIMEAAILFESGANRQVDRVATVVASLEERIQRVMLRNNLSREQIQERIRNQMTDEERTRLSDYIIYNSEKDMIIPAVIEIHQSMLSYINLIR